VDCPFCGDPIVTIPLGDLEVMSRVDSTSAGFTDFKIPDLMVKRVPERFRKGTFCVKDPTWVDSRRGVPEASADKTEVIKIHRAMSALYWHDGESAPKKVPTAEVKSTFPVSFMHSALRSLDESVPHIVEALNIKCPHCGGASEVPFDQAVS
jgi:hypothetical protein